MRLLRIIALAFVVAGSITLAPQEAHAVDWTIKDSAVSDRPHQLDVTGFIWPFGRSTSFGGAVWYSIPIVPKGFIPPFNDSFALEFGAIASMVNDTRQPITRNYFALAPMGGVRWDFFLTRDWTLFAAAKIGWLWDSSGRVGNSLTGSISVGAYWRFSRDLWLRIETGNLGIAQVGIALPI